MMILEIATICFCVSAFSRKNMMGAGLGVALVFFTIDMMCRIVPAIENFKYITPFYFSNATDIFTDTEICGPGFVISILITIASIVLAIYIYQKKDFSA